MFFSQEVCFINAELGPLYGNQWSESTHCFINSQMLQYLKKYNCCSFLFSWIFCGVFCLFVCLGWVFFFPFPDCSLLSFHWAITLLLPKLFTTYFHPLFLP